MGILHEVSVIKSTSNKGAVSPRNPSIAAKREVSPAPTELELESVDYFVSFAQVMGFPKSIGQIYGLLFMSFEPIPMDVVVSKLGISKGSASQGLNLLRDLRAVKSLRVAGDRREFFEADFDLTRIVQHFLDEKLGPRLSNAEDRLDRMMAKAATLSDDGRSRSIAEGRLQALNKWQNRGNRFFPLIRKFFKR